MVASKSHAASQSPSCSVQAIRAMANHGGDGSEELMQLDAVAPGDDVHKRCVGASRLYLPATLQLSSTQNTKAMSELPLDSNIHRDEALR